MSAITNTFTRYDAKGLREQLTEKIFDITPRKTPVISAAGRVGMDQTLIEWQLDSLAATDTGNAQIDGDDVTTFPAVTPTQRVGNHSQISRKLLILSDTLEVVNKAGRKSEEAYQLAKRGDEWKRDVEAIVLANIGGDAGSSSTPRKTATFGAWLKTNVDKEASGGNPTYTSGVPGAPRTDGTPRALTETMFKNVAQLIWEAGGEVEGMKVYAPAAQKVKISAFVGVVTRQIDIRSARPAPVIASVDVYVTDWGTLDIVPSRFGRSRDLYFLDSDMYELGFLRPLKRVKLAKTGDAEKTMLIGEWALKVNNEAAHGLVADLS